MDASIYSTLIREISTPPSISQQRLIRAEYMVGREGFEPSYTYVSRFTVCRL